MTLELKRCDSNGGQFCHAKLLSEDIYPHPVSELQLIETHISCVVLTGDFAYKIKKNVDMGFVDYTSLQKRKHFCEMEVELNRRFAPQLYLGVAPILRTRNGIVVGPVGNGRSEENAQPQEKMPDARVIDYAVVMKQFPEDALVVDRLCGNMISEQAIEEFGGSIADFHATLETNNQKSKFGLPQQILGDAQGNFSVLRMAFSKSARGQCVQRLESWTQSTGVSLSHRMASRRKEGRVRCCHGDLHLKNIIQVDGHLIPFDGIEFNPAFQWIDVLSEIAFPVMDFWARGRGDLGWRLLNSYLEATGDYEDLALLRFYLVYRALVRAKVGWLNPGNHSENRRAQYSPVENPSDPLAGPWDKYLRAAEYFAFGLNPSLSITHGFSGSGKSTVAMNWLVREGGVRIRSDVERIRLQSNYPTFPKYSAEMSDLVYQRLHDLASSSVAAQLPVIIDATFLERDRRRLFRELAREQGVPFRIYDCRASVPELRSRLQQRKNDPSDADINVLMSQLENHDPLTEEELGFVLRTDALCSRGKTE